MRTGDSREGGFDEAKFRDGIRFAMRMGTPQQESERIIFRWTSENIYDEPDVKGKPYDWTSTAAATTTAADKPVSLSIPAAFEFFDSKTNSGSTAMGDFEIATVKITILDEDWAAVQDVNLERPDLAVIDGAEYDIDYIAPPVGLFGVTVYQVFCSARSES